ncbi:acyltransferase family protein [Qipengyuania nanhaisediminis]|uniref:acyltransferase family protein n=1 Tax=Qipengyuania nanhaisediminis TaxID=604088 RepID=UPI0038B41251
MIAGAGTLSPGAHRPDIEGLRGLAVIAVLLFHLDIAVASGGFVGVDVFFVISGFLIGGIVVREQGAGAFRFGAYLVRRIKRIVPVMIAVLGAVTLAAMALLLPAELESYGWSLGFSALFLANAHFWLHRGAYAESEFEPLLHMWTLGVEAQFYLVLPLITLVLARLGRGGLWAGLAIVGVISAAASLAWPGAAFYMLPARLWEFVLGMMVAITPLPMLKARWLREALALAGLALIGFAIATFDIGMAYPGWRAAIPCLGAAALIAAGGAGTSLAGCALTLAPVRFLGAISYSLYLWHWPVIVFLLLGLPAPELTTGLKLAAAAIAILLSIASWRLVERPLRKQTAPARPIVLGCAIGTGVLVLVAVSLVLFSGWPQRLSPRGQAIAAHSAYPLDEAMRSGECFIHHRSQVFDSQACIAPDDGRPRVLVVGDSHAAHLVPGFVDAFPGSAISQVTAAGCRPVHNAPAGRYPFCRDLVERAVAPPIADAGEDLVVLAGRWENGDLPALSERIARLRAAGREVLVIGPVAEWQQFVPRLLAIAHERGQGAALPEGFRLGHGESLDAAVARVSTRAGADYFSILSAHCDPRCRYFGPSGAPMVVDNSHFTREASRVLASEIDHPALVRSD